MQNTNSKTGKNVALAIAGTVIKAKRGRPTINDGRSIRLVPMRLSDADYSAIMSLEPGKRGDAIMAGVRSNSALRKRIAA